MEESTLNSGQLKNGSVLLVLISKALLRWPRWWDFGAESVMQTVSLPAQSGLWHFSLVTETYVILTSVLL